MNTFYKMYKKYISPCVKYLFAGGCRFTPTCSTYAKDAYLKYGIIKGSFLSVKRVIKCNPWNEGGHDPLI